MKKDFLKYGNLIALVLVVVINILATIGVFGGFTTREVSYMYKSMITPADYTFSVWSVIYILLAILVFIQMKNEDVKENMSIWFIVSCVLNIAWIFAWQYRSIALSFGLILALLIDLILLMACMKGSNTISSMAVGLYTGWINVAMLANLGAMFAYYGWTFSTAWAIVCLAFGLVWITFFLVTYSNPYYALAAIWGYVGIAIGSEAQVIQIIALVSMFILAGSTILVIAKNNS